MKINKNLTPYNRWEGRRGDRVEWIVLHYTANTWQPDLAENEAKAFAAEYVGASAHFFVDQTSVWQSVAVEDTAWHCGDAPSRNGCRNTNSIGIEMCVKYDAKTGVYSIPAATARRAAALVAELLTVYPDAQLCRHYDVTGKRCPLPWVDDPALWEDFLKIVEEYTPMTPAEKKEFDKLKHEVETLKKALEVMGRDVNKIDVRTEPKYFKVEDLPPYYRPTIEKLVKHGSLKGDKNGNLNLTEDITRAYVVNDREGCYGV